MTKTNKIKAILTAVLVIAIIAFAAETVSCIREAKAPDLFLMGTVFSALTIAFSSLDKKKPAEEK